MKRRLALVVPSVVLASLLGGACLRAAPLPPPAVNPQPGAGAAAAEDIHDIHGPIVVNPGRPWWPYAAGAALVAAAAAGIALHGRRRRRRETPAARALAALAALAPYTSADARGFSFTVSEIVRGYVEEAFTLRAAHRTTEELLGDLMRDESPVAAHRARLGELLRYCDLAKFAGWSLSETDMAAMLAVAESFVRDTAAPDKAANAPVAVSTAAHQGASA